MNNYIALMFLTLMSVNSYGAIIELNFMDNRGDGDPQQLIFDSEIYRYGPFGEPEFSDVSIYDRGRLFELEDQTSRNAFAEYSGSFYFNVQTRYDSPIDPSVSEHTRATIRSEYVSRLGYAVDLNLTPSILEDLLDSMVGQNDFFSYDFTISKPGLQGLYTTNYRTTLTSWNYQVAVSEPSSLWLAVLGVLVIFRKRMS